MSTLNFFSEDSSLIFVYYCANPQRNDFNQINIWWCRKVHSIEIIRIHWLKEWELLTGRSVYLLARDHWTWHQHCI